MTIFALLTAAAAFAEAPKTIDEYWAESELKFDYLENWVNNENCYEDPTGHAFVGCLFALNSLFESPNENAQSIVITEKKIAIAPYLELSAASVRELNAKIMAKAQLWLDFFNAKDSEKVDFKKMLAEAKAKAVTKANESFVTSEAVNAYLIFAMDPHSALVPKAGFENDRAADGKTNVTVGIELKRGSPYPVIRTPIENGPAHKTGLRQNDQLIEVDGSSTEGQTLNTVVYWIDGDDRSKGDKIKVKVLRGKRRFSFTLAFAEVHVSNVESKYFGRSHTGFVRIHSFIENDTCEETVAAVKELREKGAKRIVLDLRGNLGGLVDEAVCVAGIFLPKGTLVTKELRLSSDEAPALFNTKEEPLLPGIPLAVLVNEISASASELLVGALQDYGRALLVGNTTYGKGTVQYMLEMTDTYPKVIFKQTRAYFLLPSGRSNQIIGIEPDVTVNGAPSATQSDGAVYLREIDQVGYALPNPGSHWTQPRPELIKHLRSCVATEKKALYRYQNGLLTALAPDYQMLYGESLLSCFIKAPAKLKNSASKPVPPTP